MVRGPAKRSPGFAANGKEGGARAPMPAQRGGAIYTGQRRRSLSPAALRFFMLLFVNICVTIYMWRQHGWIHALAMHMFLWISGMHVSIESVLKWFVRKTNPSAYSEALRRADLMVKPITEKVTEVGENESLRFGCSSMQGWRRTMEDAHTTLLRDDGGFFGIYDGHGGSATSAFCGQNMFSFVSNTRAFADGNIHKALYDGFIQIDKHLFTSQPRIRSGCTAVVLYVRDNELFCANAGDSRCVLCRDGEAVPLSVDHKPFLVSEQNRIERAGGYVINRRVNGSLALSRAIGDFLFKSNSQVPWDMQAVTSAPEVRTARLNRDKDEFAVLACDGIWDVMTNEQVIEFVRPRLQQRVDVGVIAEQLMDRCLSPQPLDLGCDNMSVIIVQFMRLPQGRGKTGSPVSMAQFLPRPFSGGVTPLTPSINIASPLMDSDALHSPAPPAIVKEESAGSSGEEKSDAPDVQHPSGGTVSNGAVKDDESSSASYPTVDGHTSSTGGEAASSHSPQSAPHRHHLSELDKLRSAVASGLHS